MSAKQEKDFFAAVLTNVQQLATSPSLKAAALPIIDKLAGIAMKAIFGKIKIPDAKQKIADLVSRLAINDARATKAIEKKRAGVK